MVEERRRRCCCPQRYVVVGLLASFHCGTAFVQLAVTTPPPSPSTAPLAVAASQLLSTPSGGDAAADAASAEKDAKKRLRRPRGAHLKRDEVTGLPIEAVYAPRFSPYLTKKKLAGTSGGTKRVRAQGSEREEGLNNAQRLRVLGGVAKGRRLESPEVYLRPMMGKVKEALYNTLLSFGLFEGAGPRFLDLFCGSGSVGVEALSRGASHVTFVDLAAECCAVAERNAVACGFEGQGSAVRGDVLRVLSQPSAFGLDAPYDVVTITPPYAEVVYGDLIAAAASSPLVREDTIVVIEYPVELGCLPHVIGDGRLVGLRNRRYGRTVLGVYICRPTGRLDMADSRPEEFISLKKQR
eukprot:TRINITY_DN8438_c0_g1_i2.p1 TRINITY_DN8438_c0_g1~~TRINITY_DN8438_c0_g1_i2.p1  ORF type:complete len:367 (-),score=105.06 TRINITY_DN8438_c0_g1_i2:319-1377(-)